jgi:hypothetical protein
VAWLFGIFSFIGFIGAALGVVAVILGVRALRFDRQHPGSGGRVKAIVGIICGLVFGGANMAAVIFLIMALRAPA